MFQNMAAGATSGCDPNVKAMQNTEAGRSIRRTILQT
jgi:hypothetical protein